ncbi:hypothetical protein AURDEDRAFT_168924 [Auricularia subglabra TFB-10046 SS5]|nr:hypothetical protein AURDEDRAFT_168924 [Auricularia subglabra TFB-10046 SS5]
MPSSSGNQLKGVRVHLERTVYCLDGEDAERALLKQQINSMDGTLVDEMKDADYIFIHPARTARDYAFDSAPGAMLSFRFAEDSFKEGKTLPIQKYRIVRDPEVLELAVSTPRVDDNETDPSMSGILVSELKDADCAFIHPARTFLDRAFESYRGLILAFNYIEDCYQEKKTLPVLNYVIARDTEDEMWRIALRLTKPLRASSGQVPVVEPAQGTNALVNNGSRANYEPHGQSPHQGERDDDEVAPKPPSRASIHGHVDDYHLEQGSLEATGRLSPELGAPEDDNDPSEEQDRSRASGAESGRTRKTALRDPLQAQHAWEGDKEHKKSDEADNALGLRTAHAVLETAAEHKAALQAAALPDVDSHRPPTRASNPPPALPRASRRWSCLPSATSSTSRPRSPSKTSCPAWSTRRSPSLPKCPARPRLAAIDILGVGPAPPAQRDLWLHVDNGLVQIKQMVVPRTKCASYQPPAPYNKAARPAHRRAVKLAPPALIVQSNADVPYIGGDRDPRRGAPLHGGPRLRGPLHDDPFTRRDAHGWRRTQHRGTSAGDLLPPLLSATGTLTGARAWLAALVCVLHRPPLSPQGITLLPVYDVNDKEASVPNPPMPSSGEDADDDVVLIDRPTPPPSPPMDRPKRCEKCGRYCYLKFGLYGKAPRKNSRKPVK